MSARTKRRVRQGKSRSASRQAAVASASERNYREASRLAARGETARARAIYEQLADNSTDPRLRAQAQNDLAAITAVHGDVDSAISRFRMALALDPHCEPARLNLALLEADAMIEGEKKLEGEALRVEGQKSVESLALRVYGYPEVADSRETKTVNRTLSETVELQPCSAHTQPSTLNAQPLTKCLLVMITYNRLEYTKLALEAVLKIDYPALELVVWDNASTDGTPDYLKERLGGLPNVRFELSPTNRGVVHPMNAVWGSNHDAQVLAKVDNDTIVPPELLRRLAECHVGSEHFGVLSGFHFRQEGAAIADERKVVAVNGARAFRQKYVGGCSVMIRRDVYEQIGPIPSRSMRPTPQPTVAGGTSPDNRPFMDGGWTWYQERLDELGYINGYPWPLVHVDHMEDTRSPHCIRTDEHEQYKQDLRGMSLEEFTQELCVWRPH